MRYLFFILGRAPIKGALILLILLAAHSTGFAQTDVSDLSSIYNSIDFGKNKPKLEVFAKAFTGYNKLKTEERLGEKSFLTLIDFSLSSNKKRLWIIDLDNKSLVDHTLVAHGKGTGNEFAKDFSNRPNSHQSSLGFYITDDIYYGKHGLSLNLNGVEEGINDNALERRIVIHGAKYVSLDFIKKYGRLGRSYGCPALSTAKAKKIIPMLADGTCLFIYYPDKEYLQKSKLLN